MAQNVYFSVGTQVADLKVASNISITSGIATFTASQANNIGVGDEIDYDVDNKKAYISGRTSDTVYTVLTATGTTPGDVAGKTVNVILRSFNSLSSAETGSSDASHLNTANLVTADIALFWACYKDGIDTNNVNVSGYTTDATRKITIFTPYLATQVGTSQRHAGTMASAGYLIQDSQNFAGIIVTTDNFVDIEGLKIDNTADPDSVSPLGIKLDGTGIYNVKSNIVRNSHVNAPGTGSGVRGIDVSEANTVYVSNNIVYLWGVGIRKVGGQINDGVIYNNTFANCDKGLTLTGTTGENNIHLKNNISYNHLDVDYQFTNLESSENNLSQDATSPDVAFRNKTVIFATGSDVYLLDETDTEAKDKGADLSADAQLAITDDILGTTRPQNSIFDIGAHEFEVVTPPSSGGGTAKKSRTRISIGIGI